MSHASIGFVKWVGDTDTGCSDWKSPKVNGCRTETVNLWPNIGKAKMSLRGGNIFEKL